MYILHSIIYAVSKNSEEISMNTIDKNKIIDALKNSYNLEDNSSPRCYLASSKPSSNFSLKGFFGSETKELPYVKSP